MTLLHLQIRRQTDSQHQGGQSVPELIRTGVIIKEVEIAKALKEGEQFRAIELNVLFDGILIEDA